MIGLIIFTIIMVIVIITIIIILLLFCYYNYYLLLLYKSLNNLAPKDILLVKRGQSLTQKLPFTKIHMSTVRLPMVALD